MQWYTFLSTLTHHIRLIYLYTPTFPILFLNNKFQLEWLLQLQVIGLLLALILQLYYMPDPSCNVHFLLHSTLQHSFVIALFSLCQIRGGFQAIFMYQWIALRQYLFIYYWVEVWDTKLLCSLGNIHMISDTCARLYNLINPLGEREVDQGMYYN